MDLTIRECSPPSWTASDKTEVEEGTVFSMYIIRPGDEEIYEDPDYRKAESRYMTEQREIWGEYKSLIDNLEDELETKKEEFYEYYSEKTDNLESEVEFNRVRERLKKELEEQE